MEQTLTKRPIHVGRNIQKFRLVRKMSQDSLAVELEEKRGKPVSQQFISELEAKETIEDDELIKQIAEILNVDADVLRNLDLDSAINIISNTFTNNQFAGYTVNNNPVFHPLDKLLEVFRKEKEELKAENENLKREIEELRKNKG